MHSIAIYLIIVDSRQMPGRLFNIFTSDTSSYNAIVYKESALGVYVQFCEDG